MISFRRWLELVDAGPFEPENRIVTAMNVASGQGSCERPPTKKNKYCMKKKMNKKQKK
jgi:hypothetical protein